MACDYIPWTPPLPHTITTVLIISQGQRQDIRSTPGHASLRVAHFRVATDQSNAAPRGLPMR